MFIEYNYCKNLNNPLSLIFVRFVNMNGANVVENRLRTFVPGKSSSALTNGLSQFE